MTQQLYVGDGVDEVDELQPETNLLSDQFSIVRFLNAGGFGITYVARSSLDREVVLKECFPGDICRRFGNLVKAASPNHEEEFRKIVRLFIQEAKSLSKLVHPNIVGVHQVFEANNTAYMVMDFIDGPDLHDVIQDHPETLTPDRIVGILKKLLRAVAFVHENGLLHRDISPDNILLDPTGEPILIDFGAARQQATLLGGVGQSAMRVVKDGYSPQELYVTGGQQFPSSDLYSLAATLYHAITGAAPPPSQERIVAVAEGRADPYVPLSGRYEDYPANVLETMDQALRILPKDRLGSAREWLDRIESRPVLRLVPQVRADLFPPRQADDSDGEQADATEAFPAKAAVSQRSRLRALPWIVAGMIGLVTAGLWASGEIGFHQNQSDVLGSPPQASETLALADIAAPAAAPETPAGSPPLSGSDAQAQPEIKSPPPLVNPEFDHAGDLPAEISPRSEAIANASAEGGLSDPMSSDALIRSTVWSIALPFETESEGGANSFPRIVEISPDAEKYPTNSWMAVGVTLFEVNGAWVSDQSAVSAAIEPLVQDGASSLQARARIKASEDGSLSDVTLTVPLFREVELANGIVLRIAMNNELWRTEVAEVPVQLAGTFSPGDVILDETVTGQPFVTSRSIDDLVAKMVVNKHQSATFTVERDGEVVQIEMPLLTKA